MFSLGEIALFVLVVLVWVCCSFAYGGVGGRKNDRKLPPGPPGLPLLGNLHLFGKFPHRDLYELSKKYGPIMYLRLGLKPTVVVSSPQAAELFLKTYDHVFASRPRNQAGELLSYGYRGLALTPYGPDWRKMRKVCTMELLTKSMVDSYKPKRKEEVDNLIRDLKDAGDTGTVVDLSAKVVSLIEELTFGMVLGSGNGCKFNIGPQLLEAVRLAGTFNLADFFPFLGALDLQGLGRRMKAINKTVDELLEKIIDQHEEDGNNQEGHQRDFIDVMLSLSKNTLEKEFMDRTGMKAMIVDLLSAALDASASVIEWTMTELIRHPRVMKKLQEELDTTIGLDRMVEESDLVKLNYLDMVVKESLRFHSVSPLLIPRESTEDVTINGYHIPKKSQIFVNIWAIGRDPDVWSDTSGEFLPERFIGADIDVRGHNFQLIPFGSGRRGCPGMQLGFMVVRLVVAKLVHCFNWELPDGMSPEELDVKEKFGLSLPRANHLFVGPIYRLHVKNL